MRTATPTEESAGAVGMPVRSEQEDDEEQRQLKIGRLKMAGLDEDMGGLSLGLDTSGDTPSRLRLDSSQGGCDSPKFGKQRSQKRASAESERSIRSQMSVEEKIQAKLAADIVGRASLQPDTDGSTIRDDLRARTASDSHRERTVSFHISDSDESDETEESSLPSTTCSGSELYEPLTPAEVKEMQAEFARVRWAMSMDNTNRMSGFSEGRVSASKSPESPTGLGPDPRSSLAAGRKTLANPEALKAALAAGNYHSIDYGKPPQAPPSKAPTAFRGESKSDFFASRRTAISLVSDRGTTFSLPPDEPDEPEPPAARNRSFFAGRRTAVSIASSSGGRYSMASDLLRQTKADSDAPKKSRLAPGLTKGEGGALPPPRRLTLFQGNKNMDV